LAPSGAIQWPFPKGITSWQAMVWGSKRKALGCTTDRWSVSQDLIIGYACRVNPKKDVTAVVPQAVNNQNGVMQNIANQGI